MLCPRMVPVTPELGVKEHPMAIAPKIPMCPEALPRQRLYLVPDFPKCPPGWQQDLDNCAPGLPARMPRTARYVAQVEWSWSPLHGRIDAYHLSLNRGRDRWVLWGAYFDEARWTFVDTHIAASAPRAGLQGADAAILLLQAYWASEAGNENNLDAFHWVNEEGLLDAGQLKEIARRVWDGRAQENEQ